MDFEYLLRWGNEIILRNQLLSIVCGEWKINP